MRRALLLILSALAVLVPATAAQAVVVDMGVAGHVGVAIVPYVHRWSGLQTVPSPGPCADPWLASDLGGPMLLNTGLCYHGGAVIHHNEVIDLTWDPLRRDWSTTRYFVEHFLRNVADASASLGTPYALTSQYRDAGGRAENQSLYDGGCIDYGAGAHTACQFGLNQASGAGHDYPASGCPVAGTNQFEQSLNGAVLQQGNNDLCLTDAQIQSEVSGMVSEENVLGRMHSGSSPLVVVMTPPGVVDCLNAAGDLCSSNVALAPPLPAVSVNPDGGNVPAGVYEVAVTELVPDPSHPGQMMETVPSAPAAVTAPTNGSSINVSSPTPLPGATRWSVYVATSRGGGFALQGSVAYPNSAPFPITGRPVSGAQPPVNKAFCSYHSSVVVGGVRVPYVVQPWSALTGCDEPDSPVIPQDPPPDVLANDVGARLVSPLSQGELAAITNPNLDAWSGLDGSEINDNGYPQGCVPLGNHLDQVTVGDSSYLLQREFNNGGVIESDPNALGCAGVDNLQPEFVAPSSVSPGDAVELDGSKTASTMVVPNAGYAWDFGDGNHATGPSVVHSYRLPGTYTVTLTVTDRGGNVRSLSQPLQVLGGSGPPPPPPPPVGLKARVQLLPQSLRSVLRSGIAVRITSNLRADGFTALSISKSAARQAHLRSSRAASVVIGRGTLSGIVTGTKVLHVRIPSATVRKLAHLRHLTLTLRVTLVGAGRARQTIDAAGRY